MMGWDLNGHPVELTGWQSTAVLALLGWDTAAPLELPAMDVPGQRTTVLSTAARYDRARAAGRPFETTPYTRGMW